MSERPLDIEREAWAEAFVNGVAFIKTNADGTRERVDPRDVFVAFEFPKDIEEAANFAANAIEPKGETLAEWTERRDIIAGAIFAERNRCIRRVSNGLDFGWLKCADDRRDHLMRALRGEA